MDELFKDSKFSTIELKGNLSYNSINYNLNRNNITITDNGIENNIERNLLLKESGYNFIINSQNKNIKFILPNEPYIGLFFTFYINTDIKSLEIIPYNYNLKLTKQFTDKIFGNYIIINNKNYSLSTCETKHINTQHKINGANKINFINEPSGTLIGGNITIKCIDKIYNDVEGLNVRNLTSTSGILYWNTPINMYDFTNQENQQQIKYTIKRKLNNNWLTLKDNLEQNYYIFNNIQESDLIFKVCVENNNGIIINIKLPKTDSEIDLLDYKVKYDYYSKNTYIWSIDGIISAELNDKTNPDFETIFK